MEAIIITAIVILMCFLFLRRVPGIPFVHRNRFKSQPEHGDFKQAIE